MKYKIFYLNKQKVKNIILESSNIESLKLNNNLPKNIVCIKEYKTFNIDNLFIKNNNIELIYEIKIMLNSNLNFKNIINILIDTNEKINKDILINIKNSLQNGQEIYKGLKVYENYLGKYTILFFKIGQENTSLKTSMNCLYEILIKNKTIKDEFVKILTYPFVILLSMILSVIVIFTFVLPKFEFIFSQYNGNLPHLTSILLDIKYIFSQHYIFLFYIIFIIIFGIYILYKKYKYNFDKFIIQKIPIFSLMYKNILLYRLFISLHLLVKSNNTFYNSLYSIKEMINNEYLLKHINNILNDINKGIDIHKSFLNTKIFDSTTISLLKIAQESNNMETLLNDITNIYTNKVQKSMNSFKTFLEPLLILIMASIILFLVIAILSPIWDLSTVIN